ncbi:putative membrane protein [Agromyces terreus]|uniref:Membrane protein n=1 Tax=Agromyces terreus TaxID=424795 RepID=A0A9X2KBI6_9MICO|nr:DUF2254 domain-containing protein [Agromyces terreus]MCP2370644.1 putative membrane protein [Agromyces terreus]
MTRTADRRGTTERRWAVARDAVATRLWPLPVAAVVAAVILGIVVPIIDVAVDPQLAGTSADLLFGSGTAAARSVLSAIAGSMITVTSLTFSLTVVALQLASSQASPRVLRLFAADRTVHATLALFLGTFAYSLTVLRTVSDSGEGFTPRIAVTLASLLTFASVIQLTVFLAHLARQLRVETVMRDVHAETDRTIALLVQTSETPAATAPAEPDEVELVVAPGSGFITGVDRRTMIEVAVEHDLVVRELRAIGANVIEGTAMLEWWPRPAGAQTEELDGEAITRRLAAAVQIGYERTPTQDVGYGVRQLVDIAARALSPGINDPTTAVHALGHLSALLADLGGLPPTPPALADDRGIARSVPALDGFEELLELAVQQPRRYGVEDPAVVRRLYLLFDELGERVRDLGRRGAIRRSLDRLDASVAAARYLDEEREEFDALSRRARARL